MGFCGGPGGDRRGSGARERSNNPFFPPFLHFLPTLSLDAPQSHNQSWEFHLLGDVLEVREGVRSLERPF